MPAGLIFRKIQPNTPDIAVAVSGVFCCLRRIKCRGGIGLSYTIRYGPEVAAKQKRSSIGVFTCVLIAALLLCGVLNQFAPKQTLEILFPWTSESVQEAFHSFQQEIDQGTSFYEAFEAFCTNIVNDGKTEYRS